MLVASFNIYKGARDKYSLLIDFVQRHDIEVLCLQEADGWHEGDHSRIEDFAETTGLSEYIFGDSNTDSKLITFSRHPIDQEKSKVYTEDFFHCAIKTVIRAGEQEHTIWNAHLNPFDEDKRLREAAFIAQNALHDIVVGDLNSLSRSDGYTREFADQLAAQGNKRYGDGDLRYDTTDYFARAGYIDIAAASKTNSATFPARTDTELHPPHARFDYVFAPPDRAGCIESVEVVKDSTTLQISDHFPLKIQVTTVEKPQAPVSQFPVPKSLYIPESKEKVPVPAAA